MNLSVKLSLSEQKITLFAGNNKLIPRQKPILPYQFDTIWMENCDELNKLKLRLRHSKSLTSNFSEEQDEYNYVSSINKSLDGEVQVVSS